MESVLPFIYLLASAGFILAIKWMNHPSTARRGVIIGELGMLLAVIGTLLRSDIHNYTWILLGLAIGSDPRAPPAQPTPPTRAPPPTQRPPPLVASASSRPGR